MFSQRMRNMQRYSNEGSQYDWRRVDVTCPSVFPLRGAFINLTGSVELHIGLASLAISSISEQS